MAFGLKEFQHVLLEDGDGLERPTMVLAIVLFVPNATLSMNLQCMNWVLRNTPFGIHVEPKNDSRHGSTSIGVVRFGVRLGLQTLALTDFSDHLVKELRWENLETKVLRVPHGSSLRCCTDVV